MSEPLITVKDIAVVLGGRQILDGVTCTVPRGSITCLVGESGCGKTTLLRTMLGLVSPTDGEVRLLGHLLRELDERRLSEVRLRVGVLFQNGALLNSLNVFENVALPLEHHTDLPDPVIAEIVRGRLGVLNVADAVHRLPSEISGGMKKRVALARSLVLEPELLFLDEPSAGLDPVTSGQLDQVLASLRDTLGTTLVLVTHELRSIRAIADRIVFLKDGRVAFEGPLAEAEESDHPALRRFFADTRRD